VAVGPVAVAGVGPSSRREQPGGGPRTGGNASPRAPPASPGRPVPFPRCGL